MVSSDSLSSVHTAFVPNASCMQHTCNVGLATLASDGFNRSMQHSSPPPPPAVTALEVLCDVLSLLLLFCVMWWAVTHYFPESLNTGPRSPTLSYINYCIILFT